MNIALFISKFYPEYSGANLRIINFYKDIKKKRDLNIDVYSGSKEHIKKYFYRYKFFNVRKFKESSGEKYNLLKKFNYLIIFLKVFFILKKKQYDFIHIVGSSEVTTAAINVASFFNFPRIIELVTKNSSPFQFLPFIKYFYRPNFNYNSLIITINNEIIKKLKFKISKSIIWTRDNPINSKFKYPNNYKLKKNNIGFLKTDILITQIAQFYESKNQIFLLDVLKYLPKKYKLLLAGPISLTGPNAKKDIEYLENIRKKIKFLNLNQRVKIIPNFVKSHELINISDITLMPNFNEGFGNPLVESLGLGIPVIANSEENIFKKYIQNKKNGYLVKLNAKKWAQKILDLNLNYSREKISKNIHNKICYKKFLNNHIKIFDFFKKINNKSVKIGIKKILNEKK